MNHHLWLQDATMPVQGNTNQRRGNAYYFDVISLLCQKIRSRSRQLLCQVKVDIKRVFCQCYRPAASIRLWLIQKVLCYL